MDTVLAMMELPLSVPLFGRGGEVEVPKVCSEIGLISKKKLDMNYYVRETRESVKYALNCNKKYTR